MTITTSELVWLKGLLKELGINKDQPVKIYSDSKAALQIVANLLFYLTRTAPPLAVLHPASAQDISQLIKAAYRSDFGFTVSSRGHGHSISGQAQPQTANGVVVQMSGSKQGSGRKPPQPRVWPRERYLDAWGGELWIDVLRSSLEYGLAPKSWTDYLYLSVGGTLSNAGISGQAFNHGPQISNVHELDVVTGIGDLLTCSEEQNSELFHSVLGQFGIITKARISLEPALQRVRWIRVLYSNFSASLHAEPGSQKFDYIEGSRFVVEEIRFHTGNSLYNRSAVCGFLGSCPQGGVEAPIQGFMGGSAPMVKPFCSQIKDRSFDKGVFKALDNGVEIHSLEYLTNQNREILRFCDDAEINVKQYLPHYATHEEWMNRFGNKNILAVFVLNNRQERNDDIKVNEIEQRSERGKCDVILIGGACCRGRPFYGATTGGWIAGRVWADPQIKLCTSAKPSTEVFGRRSQHGGARSFVKARRGVSPRLKHRRAQSVLANRGVSSWLKHRGAQSFLTVQRCQFSTEAQRHRGASELQRMVCTRNGGEISSHRGVEQEVTEPVVPRMVRKRNGGSTSSHRGVEQEVTEPVVQETGSVDRRKLEEIEAALAALRAHIISGDRMRGVEETQEDLLETVTDLGNEARDAIGVIQLGYDELKAQVSVLQAAIASVAANPIERVGFKDGVCSITTWDALKKELKTSFLPENMDYNARKKLRELSHTGTIREYVREFSTLMLDIKDMSERDKLFHFLEGLKPCARLELQRHRVQDLTVAIAVVECLNDYNDHPGKRKTPSTSGSNTQHEGRRHRVGERIKDSLEGTQLKIESLLVLDRAIEGINPH
ncbi:Cytokinin dehydrogenase 5 [Hibiscus syriacus]|uniref:cytokinin dehydrogenase n=1 Tax=Hibiscus syriacus TaxID=106335 RepID=A0A6A3B9J8_HIBSY|nr:Cytokinin dehydrogenase 5 [Hibiscus syriacus]